MKKYLVQRFEGRKKVYINKSDEEETNDTKIGLHCTGSTGATSGPLYYYYVVAQDFEAAKKLIADKYPESKIIIQ